MYRGTKLLLFCILAAASVNAQDLDADLQQITQSIDSAASMSIETNVNVYGRKGGSVIYTSKASIHRNAAASLTRLGEQEYFTGKQYDVTIDHEEKSVLILKKEQASKKQKKEKLDLDVSALRTMLESNEKDPRVVKLVSSAAGKKTYSVSNVPGMKEVRVSLDMNDLSIRQVTYEFSEQSENKGQYVTVTYGTFKKNAEVDHLLKTSNFFSESGGSYVLSARLKNYKLYTEL